MCMDFLFPSVLYANFQDLFFIFCRFSCILVRDELIFFMQDYLQSRGATGGGAGGRPPSPAFHTMA